MYSLHRFYVLLTDVKAVINELETRNRVLYGYVACIASISTVLVARVPVQTLSINSGR